MDLRKSKYILPNLFTLGSVFFAVLALTSSLAGSPEGFVRGAMCVLISMVADSLDGRVARMTRTATKFGVQLDSLADVVAFGMAPAILAYTFVLRTLDAGGGMVGVVAAFVYVSCGALRLARFNVMADNARKPSTTFTGLPIPAAAGVVALLVWSCIDLNIPEAARLPIVTGGLVASAALMVSNIPYRNFKHTHVRMAGRVALLVLAAAILATAVKTHASVVLLGLCLAYVTMGPAEWLVGLPARHARRRRGLPPREEEG